MQTWATKSAARYFFVIQYNLIILDYSGIDWDNGKTMETTMQVFHDVHVTFERPRLHIAQCRGVRVQGLDWEPEIGFSERILLQEYSALWSFQKFGAGMRSVLACL